MASAPSSTRRTASRRPASASTSSRWPRGEPDTFYQRNHCGVYRSDDGSETWQEITGDLPTDFGFAMIAHPRDATRWVIPLSTPEEGRFMPDATRRSADARPGRLVDPFGRWIAEQDAYMSVCARRWPATRSTRSGSRSGPHGPALAQLGRGCLVADDHRHAARDLGGRGGRHRLTMATSFSPPPSRSSRARPNSMRSRASRWPRSSMVDVAVPGGVTPARDDDPPRPPSTSRRRPAGRPDDGCGAAAVVHVLSR